MKNESLKELWKRIENFELEKEDEEFGFLTKLSYENSWSVQFTEDAVYEYKKFMFLAAVSNTMVSPSKIIDIVWHQHLTYSKSYEEFCAILGKKIKHIPSTGKKEEKEVLKKAVDYTKNAYSDYFEDRNETIWSVNSFEESIKTDTIKGRLKYINDSQFTILGIPLLVPVFFLWKPVLLQIDNPYFIMIAVVLIIIAFSGIELLTNSGFNKVMKKIAENRYFKTLHSYELITLVENDVRRLIVYKVNDLFHKDALTTSKKNTKAIQLGTPTRSEDLYENVILNYYEEHAEKPLDFSLQQIRNKPAYKKIENVATLVREKIINSKRIVEDKLIISILTFTVYSFILSRLILGIMRDKPVFLLVILIAVTTVMSYFYLSKLYQRKLRKYFRDVFVEEKTIEEDRYLNKIVHGEDIVLVSAVGLLLVNNNLKKLDPLSSNFSSDSSGSDNDSCSSCSSCSSCGGCGGCGGD